MPPRTLGGTSGAIDNRVEKLGHTFWTGAVGPQLGDVGANLYTPLWGRGLAQLRAVHAGGTCKLLVPGLEYVIGLPRLLTRDR